MLVLTLGLLRNTLRRTADAIPGGMARGLGRGEAAPPLESRDAHDPVEVPHGDAGWAQLLDTEGQAPRGRGRLMLSSEAAGPDGARTFEANVESFVPGEAPITPGDRLLLLIEMSNEQYPVTVRSIDPGGTAVALSWGADELPATLRELGGN
jgi:hypothetical protein